MGSMTRTFVAATIPAARAEKLARLRTSLAADLPAARWSDPAQAHVTLAFLGDVRDVELFDICREIERAVAGFEPFELSITGLGAFPDESNPRTLWVGLAGPEIDRLIELQASVVAAATRAGRPPRDDRFHPHITIARFQDRGDSAAAVASTIKSRRDWSAGSFKIAEVVTFASNLTPKGPIYDPLASASLIGDRSRRSTSQ